MPNSVTDNAALNRYELTTDGGISFVKYRTLGSIRTFTHA